MVKAILGEAIEQLEQIAKQTVTQAAKLPTEVAKDALESVVKGKTSSQAKVDPLTGLEVPTPQKVKQLKKQEAKRKAAAIPHAQQIIYGVAKRPPTSPVEQLPVSITGKTGFDKDKMLKRMEGIETEKPELPPPVSASKPKWGTAERKGGVSG